MDQGGESIHRINKLSTLKPSLVIHEMIPFEAMQLSIVQKFLRLVNGNKRLEQDILVIYHKWSML